MAARGDLIVSRRPKRSLYATPRESFCTEALRLGTPDLHWSDLGTLGNWRPELGFISLSFIFTGFDHVKRVIYGPVGAQVKTDVRSELGQLTLDSVDMLSSASQISMSYVYARYQLELKRGAEDTSKQPA